VNPFRRKPRYTLPNPEVPVFNSVGGNEMWKMMLDHRDRLSVLEASQRFVIALLLVLTGSGVAVAVSKYM